MATSPRAKRPPVPEETLPATRHPVPPPDAVSQPVPADEFPVPELPSHDVPATANVGCLGLTRVEKDALARELPTEWFRIRPQGEIYLPVDKYRRVLDEVIGPGDWGLAPTSDWQRLGTLIYREWTLYIRGRKAGGPAIGGETWKPENARMTFADACESARSNGLSRCCKDLAIALRQAYDEQWRDDFLERLCVHVFVEEYGKVEARWRLKSAPPFTGTITDERGQKRHGIIERSEVKQVSRAYRRPPAVRAAPRSPRAVSSAAVRRRADEYRGRPAPAADRPERPRAPARLRRLRARRDARRGLVSPMTRLRWWLLVGWLVVVVSVPLAHD